MASSKRRDYGSGSVSQMKNGKWTARMVIGVNENGKPKIKALYGDTEREVKRKLKEFQIEFYKNDQSVVQRSTVESYKVTRDCYFLYEIADRKLTKLGKASSPLELEEKFKVKERMGCV